MVNRKVSQASSRSAPASPRKADKEPTKRPAPAATTTTRTSTAAAKATSVTTAPAKAAAARPGAETPSRLAGVQRTFRETVAELRKVQWPDRVTTRNLTLVVIGMSTVLAALLGTFDAILTRLIDWLITL
jgi:preprotein translocase subunit SecE